MFLVRSQRVNDLPLVGRDCAPSQHAVQAIVTALLVPAFAVVFPPLAADMSAICSHYR
jgi:hypothetical protein